MIFRWVTSVEAVVYSVSFGSFVVAGLGTYSSIKGLNIRIKGKSKHS